MFPESQGEEVNARIEWVREYLIADAGVQDILAPKDVRTFEEEFGKHISASARGLAVCSVQRAKTWAQLPLYLNANLRRQTFGFQVAEFSEEEQPISPVTTNGRGEELFAIFPRIYFMKSESQRITAGTILRKGQLHAATQEVCEGASDTPFTQPALTRHRSRRSRRTPMNAEGARGGTTKKRLLSKAVTWNQW
ncbi:hypothetical protein K469DRAFT_685398 [Zopfia rhizophila CBS 207.26]|uniref:Uncharacterized protein n=1 Tax=Zopfia rhizophila CBS 207.26 TaxID=1314779 RepID=A0A6A6D9A7_9PEZI|nr:hypothetical protein K469DRAFT_685398 [Zopfia rhizophila CBS 207.26]